MPCGIAFLPAGILSLTQEGAAHLPGIVREEQLLPILSTAISCSPLAWGEGTQHRVIHPKSCPKDLAEAAFGPIPPASQALDSLSYSDPVIPELRAQILGPEPLR